MLSCAHNFSLSLSLSLSLVSCLYAQFSGQIGGNGSGGPIYGELTVGSMQRVTEIMKRHLNLNSSSRFVDVGAGLGKPNVHVGCDPGVEVRAKDRNFYISMRISPPSSPNKLTNSLTPSPTPKPKRSP